jgi:SOS-response transcriptional repressor LexA
MSDLNWKQREAARRRREEILKTIEDFIDEHGYPPTRQEVADLNGCSLETASRQIRTLISEGRLTEGNGPRTLAIAF